MGVLGGQRPPSKNPYLNNVLVQFVRKFLTGLTSNQLIRQLINHIVTFTGLQRKRDIILILESNSTGPNKLHFFLVGAGALIDSGSSKNYLLNNANGKPINNACLNGNPVGHRAHCYFYWFTKVTLFF